MMILQDVPIGIVLHELRAKNGWSQSDVCMRAQLLGSVISRSTYSLIELGKRNIKASDLIIFRHVFKTSYEVLLGDNIPL